MNADTINCLSLRMLTKARREDALLELFLSAYDENTWADAELR